VASSLPRGDGFLFSIFSERREGKERERKGEKEKRKKERRKREVRELSI
jgi:hypothetical protein